MHGIDVGGPQVRYAHGRAESLGVAAHFSQQDATATDFPDGHFDLVVSILLTHECPQPVIRALFKEAHRLLAPGGFTMHDGGAANSADPFEHQLLRGSREAVYLKGQLPPISYIGAIKE